MDNHIREATKKVAEKTASVPGQIMTKDEALEELAQCVDEVDNLVSAMAISVPAEIHLSALKESLPDLKGRIKQVYFELGGNDVWSV